MKKHVIYRFILCFCAALCFSTPGATEPLASPVRLVAPVEGAPMYPFTKAESTRCSRWRRNSQDYPYFGAPRDGNTRHHAGVDIYPEGGTGSPVRAMADGSIVRIAPFYTRANGEVTYAVLVDHPDFVANYAEVRKPDLKVGAFVTQGQMIGKVSGTKQLHLELYAKGTRDWSRWYGQRPDNLMDPRGILLELFPK